MTTTGNLDDFTSYMKVSFTYDNGIKVFQCETDAERIETNDLHFIVFTRDGEEIHYPVNQVKNLRIQSMLRANYHHQAPMIDMQEVRDSNYKYFL